MKNYNVISFSNLFDERIEELGNEELIAKLKGLLSNIPSKSVIRRIAKINFEIFFNPSDSMTQNQIWDYWLEGIDVTAKTHLKERIGFYTSISKLEFIFFGERYILDFYNFIFENYNGNPERKLTQDEILNTLKAYSIIVYISNKKDEQTFLNKEGSTLFESLQRITWPFIINQYECNNRPDGIVELIKFCAAVKEIFLDVNLQGYLKGYMKFNGFRTIRQLLEDSYLLFTIPDRIYQKADYHKRIPVISLENKKLYLQNISIDSEYYKIKNKENIYYKLLKEKPLFKLNENDYAILDPVFLKMKLYTGFIFDFYYQSSMEKDGLYPQFKDFKSGFPSKKVIEAVVFKKLLERIFIQGNNVVWFDSKEKISVPDCFCRSDNKIYFIELKDYLLNGNKYQTYSYEVIKEAIDQKFINGVSGIKQIKRQINNYLNSPDEFPCDRGFSRTSKKMVIYPIIVHTDFIFSLPGIQQYLDEHLKAELKNINIPSNILIQDLTLINLDTFILHYYNFIENSKLLSTLIDKYFNDVKKDMIEFLNSPDEENNYTRAHRSFAIEYAEKYRDEAKDDLPNFINVIYEIRNR
ncbi:MAG TPA: hypothetical protein VMU83_04000 [Hanamia sp.]|nr:hypothetical protein [Hanamia sp.]